jgi:hypothetical protein
MAFSEADRVQIRRYLGFPAIYVTADPRLESAITAVQSVADGGSRPNNTTELAVQGYLAKLATVETRIEDLFIQMQVGTVDEVEIDAPRGLLGLRSIGRQYVGHIADTFAMKPARDVFSAPEIGSY